MRWLEVEHGPPIYGTVQIPGSKNSALALLTAACLADDPVVLSGIPNIEDFRVIQEICTECGITMKRQIDGTVYIDSRTATTAVLNYKLTSGYRASYYFAGALLAKHSIVKIGYPGGDDFVSRPIDQHIKGFKALGAAVTFQDNHYVVETKRLIGNDIYFDTITSGATMNIMMAAALADGVTMLRGAARDPEVVDTANFLNQMGAKISGAGTDNIRIVGVKALHGCHYTAIPDRLVAGTMLMTAGITGGSVTVENVIPEHLESCLTKLEEIGMEFKIGENSITAAMNGRPRAVRVRTSMYPGFATDLQQPLTALLAAASGRSVVTDTVYPKRFKHIHQLNRMGARIELRGSSSAVIYGGRPLQGSLVHATDVRAGVCLILAALNAEGTTMITGLEHIERGYENFEHIFASVGVNIKVKEGELLETNKRGIRSRGEANQI